MIKPLRDLPYCAGVSSETSPTGAVVYHFRFVLPSLEEVVISREPGDYPDPQDMFVDVDAQWREWLYDLARMQHQEDLFKLGEMWKTLNLPKS